MVNNDGKANVTRISDWKHSGFILRAWICTKRYFANGWIFDWREEKNKWEWPK